MRKPTKVISAVYCDGKFVHPLTASIMDLEKRIMQLEDRQKLLFDIINKDIDELLGRDYVE